GMDRQVYMRMKFGDDPMKIVEMHKLIAAEGEKEGIAFDFAAITRRPNTLDSHRLIRWAETAGVQDEVVERLFIAYFENGEDIGDVRVLADIADICGMDGVEIAQMLESDTDLNLVTREDQIAREMGVTGVPAMIFGNKLAVSGAREPEVLVSVIDRVTEMTSGEPQPEPVDEEDEEEDEE
ncbi:MAG: DsbA family oxidoreductase, partial [Alphaproteobacteria bacterium]|nr:DsbA family oxidoreductase [Alphaproteobacteria bacterium]